MINEFAHEFWERRARTTDASIRWTDHRMLELDAALVGSLLPHDAAVLDLGCGTGDVFLAVLDQVSHVTAVDMIPEFLDRIPPDPRVTTVESDLSTFQPGRTYDVGLLFGVVTHLTLEQESAVYDVLRHAVPEGVVVVKNQCGRDEDLDIDTYSEAFAGRYVGRYPHVQSQAERLRSVFGSVDVVPYPAEVNRWPDSVHVAFVCRGTA